jgi:arylsulfatase A-like enzyme
MVLSSILGCAAETTSEYLDLVGSYSRAVVVESPAGSPRTDTEAGFLFLPAGSEVAYAFLGHPRSSLAIGRVATRGEGTRLALRLESDGEGVFLERDVERAGSDLSIELPFEPPEGEGIPIRLTLRAESEAPAPGDGVLLTAAVIHGLSPALPEVRPIEFERGATPDVVLYVIDTLRRDRLGAYGYDRPVSPHIDDFARQATVFERGVGQSSWTKPSVASMLTGLWPPAHGAIGGHHRLPERIETLAERLRAAGYETASFVTNPNAGPEFGFAQGVDHFWVDKKAHGDRVNEEVLTWLDGRDGDGPFFLNVHTMEPHAGYKPVEPYRSRFAPTADEMKPWRPRWRWPVENLPFFSDLYDGEIAQIDAAFGALVAALRERGRFDSALVAVLSDHGEEFQEHSNWRHGRMLYRETLNVPIVVKHPHQRRGVRSEVPASHVDVLPTVLDATGLPTGEGLDGQSLAAAVERPVFSHLDAGRAPPQHSVIAGGWKLILVYGERGRTLLFDLRADPSEERNLADELPVRRAVLEGLLRERLAASAPGETEEVELSDDLRRSLRALGYLR